MVQGGERVTRHPTFMVIGAAKSGTTSLSAYLRSHPDVFMPQRKEPHYFSVNMARGLDWYLSLFADAGDETAIGEASTSYSQAPKIPDVPARIAKEYPAIQLVYVIRDPVARIRSQYAHYVDRGREERPIAEALRASPDYLDVSRYAYQLRLYLDHFPRDQIMVVSSDRLLNEREAVLDEIFSFIGVDPTVPIATVERELNRTADKRQAPGIVNRVRRAARGTAVSRMMPRFAKQRLRVALSRPLERDTLDIDPSTEAWIWDQLADDLADLRSLVGPGFDLWGRA